MIAVTIQEGRFQPAEPPNCRVGESDVVQSFAGGEITGLRPERFVESTAQFPYRARSTIRRREHLVDGPGSTEPSVAALPPEVDTLTESPLAVHCSYDS